jgi:hypothetical protein
MTMVYAGSYDQFSHWCRYSRVSRYSRMVKYISEVWGLRGYRDFDIVYTGTDKPLDVEIRLMNEIRYHEITGSILKTWFQRESREIDPDVVD